MISNASYAHFFVPRAVLRVTGADAFSFLQGQFTNELRHVAGVATYGLWLNQKGRVVADSRVLCLAENEFLVVSDESPAEVIRQRLEEYIVADEVVVTQEAASVGTLIVGGKTGEAWVDNVFGDAVSLGKFLVRGDAMVFCGHMDNYQIFGPAGLLITWRDELTTAGCASIGFEGFERLRISAGIPAVPRDLALTDLPNEGGLEQTAISYTKGCYLGQEVMARLKNLGQVRRRLQVVHGTGPLPQARALLFQGQEKVGELRSVAGEGTGFVALAMLSLLQLRQGEGLSLVPEGPRVVGLGPTP